MNINPTGKERYFDAADIIVSKTNLKGHITYINKTFMDISGFDESDLLDKPHSIIRHPDMPRCVFKLLWDTLAGGHEIFAYVKNMCKNGDHYWVLAHVTPSFDTNHSVCGYHSTRRVPDQKIVKDTIIPLYDHLLTEEGKHSNRKEGLRHSYDALQEIIQQKGTDYARFIFSLQS
tara:strand:+ start:387 stop:911 length:525 start_codon:yes stop_codon:yes gene_type:complete